MRLENIISKTISKLKKNFRGVAYTGIAGLTLFGVDKNIANADVFHMDQGLTSLEFVTIGNPGNAPDMRYNLDLRPEGYGAVPYVYKMGKYEVTAGQYTEFLNAVARTDTYGLYHTNMDVVEGEDWPYGCNIKQNGSSGNYQYSIAPDWANRPVNWVSWGDAARFANWLTNGQPTGSQDSSTTEDGSYYLYGTDLMAVTRKSPEQGGRYYIPTEDEWYKAAYHKNDGITGNYWDYPTNTDVHPNNVLINPDPGNNANFYIDSYIIGSPYWRTEVGEFENSKSPYGTFDQGGNVSEWNEGIINYFPEEGYERGLRGDEFGGWWGYYMFAGAPYVSSPSEQQCGTGFRITEIPEPSTLGMLMMGSLALTGVGIYVLRRNQKNNPDLK